MVVSSQRMMLFAEAVVILLVITQGYIILDKRYFKAMSVNVPHVALMWAAF